MQNYKLKEIDEIVQHYRKKEADNNLCYKYLDKLANIYTSEQTKFDQYSYKNSEKLYIEDDIDLEEPIKILKTIWENVEKRKLLIKIDTVIIILDLIKFSNMKMYFAKKIIENTYNKCFSLSNFSEQHIQIVKEELKGHKEYSDLKEIIDNEDIFFSQQAAFTTEQAKRLQNILDKYKELPKILTVNNKKDFPVDKAIKAILSKIFTDLPSGTSSENLPTEETHKANVLKDTCVDIVKTIKTHSINIMEMEQQNNQPTNNIYDFIPSLYFKCLAIASMRDNAYLTELKDLYKNYTKKGCEKNIHLEVYQDYMQVLQMQHGYDFKDIKAVFEESKEKILALKKNYKYNWKKFALNLISLYVSIILEQNNLDKQGKKKEIMSLVEFIEQNKDLFDMSYIFSCIEYVSVEERNDREIAQTVIMSKLTDLIKFHDDRTKHTLENNLSIHLSNKFEKKDYGLKYIEQVFKDTFSGQQLYLSKNNRHSLLNAIFEYYCRNSQDYNEIINFKNTINNYTHNTYNKLLTKCMLKKTTDLGYKITDIYNMNVFQDNKNSYAAIASILLDYAQKQENLDQGDIDICNKIFFNHMRSYKLRITICNEYIKLAEKLFQSKNQEITTKENFLNILEIARYNKIQDERLYKKLQNLIDMSTKNVPINLTMDLEDETLLEQKNNQTKGEQILNLYFQAINDFMSKKSEKSKEIKKIIDLNAKIKNTFKDCYFKICINNLLKNFSQNNNENNFIEIFDKETTNDLQKKFNEMKQVETDDPLLALTMPTDFPEMAQNYLEKYKTNINVDNIIVTPELLVSFNNEIEKKYRLSIKTTEDSNNNTHKDNYDIIIFKNENQWKYELIIKKNYTKLKNELYSCGASPEIDWNFTDECFVLMMPTNAIDKNINELLDSIKQANTNKYKIIIWINLNSHSDDLNKIKATLNRWNEELKNNEKQLLEQFNITVYLDAIIWSNNEKAVPYGTIRNHIFRKVSENYVPNENRIITAVVLDDDIEIQPETLEYWSKTQHKAGTVGLLTKDQVVNNNIYIKYGQTIDLSLRAAVPGVAYMAEPGFFIKADCFNQIAELVKKDKKGDKPFDLGSSEIYGLLRFLKWKNFEVSFENVFNKDPKIIPQMNRAPGRKDNFPRTEEITTWKDIKSCLFQQKYSCANPYNLIYGIQKAYNLTHEEKNIVLSALKLIYMPSLMLFRVKDKISWINNVINKIIKPEILSADYYIANSDLIANLGQEFQKKALKEILPIVLRWALTLVDLTEQFEKSLDPKEKEKFNTIIKEKEKAGNLIKYYTERVNGCQYWNDKNNKFFGTRSNFEDEDAFFKNIKQSKNTKTAQLGPRINKETTLTCEKKVNETLAHQNNSCVYINTHQVQTQVQTQVQINEHIKIKKKNPNNNISLHIESQNPESHKDLNQITVNEDISSDNENINNNHEIIKRSSSNKSGYNVKSHTRQEHIRFIRQKNLKTRMLRLFVIDMNDKLSRMSEVKFINLYINKINKEFRYNLTPQNAMLFLQGQDSCYLWKNGKLCLQEDGSVKMIYLDDTEHPCLAQIKQVIEEYTCHNLVFQEDDVFEIKELTKKFQKTLCEQLFDTNDYVETHVSESKVNDKTKKICKPDKEEVTRELNFNSNI